MLTESLYMSNVERARPCGGPSVCADTECAHPCTYAGVRSSSRPGNDVRKELRDDYADRQGGLCPVCGNALEFGQFNHVASAGKGRLGFAPGMVGNTFTGCATCNLDCAYRFGTVTDDGTVIDGGVIPFSHFKRPDLIPTEWTPFPILRDRHAARKASKA